jgi:hypothetical protein
MPKVTNEMLRRFNEAIDKASKRLGDGKVGLDSNAIRAAVRENKEAAYRYVEIHCVMAASQPGYLQPAIIVATAYHIEFQDATLVEMVNARAQELHAGSHLERIGYTPYGTAPGVEPPERLAAREWWKTSEKNDGMCDACAAPLRRGDGFLLNGRLMFFGKSKMNMGSEILCESCFDKYRDEPRDPDGRGEDYISIG